MLKQHVCRLYDTFALSTFAGQFARATHSFSLFTGFLLRRLFKMVTGFHFPEKAFALHLFLQGPKSLINIIIAHNDLYYR